MSTSRQSKARWPGIPEPEGLFPKVLLIYGPIPEKGWSVRRGPDDIPALVYPTSRHTRAFVVDIIEHLKGEVLESHPNAVGWSNHHLEMVARMWKNHFLIWVWKEKERATT